MIRILTGIILILLVLAITTFLLVNNNGSGKDPFSGGNPTFIVPGHQSDQINTTQDTLSAKATATYGAEQFFLQLTAIAGDDY